MLFTSLCSLFFTVQLFKVNSRPVDTDSFIVYIKTDYIHKENAGEDEAMFDTSNYEFERPVPKQRTKSLLVS